MTTCPHPGCDELGTTLLHGVIGEPDRFWCAYHERMYRVVEGLRRRPKLDGHQRGRIVTRVATAYNIAPLRDLIAHADAYDEAVAADDVDVVNREPAVIEATFPAVGREFVVSAADVFNAAAARFTANAASGRPGIPEPKLILGDLRATRNFFAHCGVKADGPYTLEFATRYADLADVAAEMAAFRVASHHGMYSGYWADLLAVPGVTALRWRTIAAQTAHIAELQASTAEVA